MQKGLLFIFLVMIMVATNLFAQNPIKLNGQPTWKKALNIADNCFFYEEIEDKPLPFEEVKKKDFVFYDKKFRVQKFSNRPLVVQWLKFKIQNTSATDSINLEVGTVHVFTRLYTDNQLIARSGAYEPIDNSAKKTGKRNRLILPVSVPPLTTTTFWLRTEDRQNHLIPPEIFLETHDIFIAAEAENSFAVRYLFLILAAITGCFLFIGIYAAYHYYLYRNSSFIWYFLYTIASFFSGLHWMDIRLGLKMFSPLFHDVIFSIFLYLIPVLYSFFIGNMLEFPKYFKKSWRLVQVFMTISILQMLLGFTEVRFNWFPWPNYYGILLTPISIILLNIILAILAAKSESPVKWFLFFGPVSLVILWCLPSMNLYSVSAEINRELFLVINFPIVFLLLGLLIEGIFFTFALTYQSKLLFLEKNKIQKEQAIILENALNKRTIELEEQSKIVAAQKIKQIETAYEIKIAESEMTALRAQMNPHFIFNCLNSIKLYTMENDTQTASEYLTKFSQLIRLVLENSRSEKISLKTELETLELYIDLEAMRFKDKVKYRINIDPNIDTQYLEIPPLLLQPYVENAIWHGLMHKTMGGNITINVSQPSEFLLHIEIEDDGIGREKAIEIKSKSATKQKSFGMKMTSERLEVINHLYQNKTSVKIIDLKDSKNNGIGTKIIMEIQL